MWLFISVFISLCSWSRTVLLSNTRLCKRGWGNFHSSLKCFWRSLWRLAATCAQKSGAACAKSGQLLRQYAVFCLLYLWPICSICSSHACSINISFISCEFGRQSTGRWLRECSPPRCSVGSEFFPLFIWTVFASFQSPDWELWSWFLFSCSWATLNVKIWVIAAGKNWETERGLLNNY